MVSCLTIEFFEPVGHDRRLVKRWLTVKQHGVAVAQMPVHVFNLKIGPVRILPNRGGDQESFCHRFTFDRVLFGDEDSLSVLVLDADGA